MAAEETEEPASDAAVGADTDDAIAVGSIDITIYNTGMAKVSARWREDTLIDIPITVNDLGNTAAVAATAITNKFIEADFGGEENA